MKNIVHAVIAAMISASALHAACPPNSPATILIGTGSGGLGASGHHVLCGSSATIRVVGAIGPQHVIFVGAGGGGAGGAAGGSGGPPQHDNGGGGGGGAGAPILGFAVVAERGDAFEVQLGTGGPRRAGLPNGASGPPGGNGTSSFVRRAGRPALIEFPGGVGGGGGIGSGAQPASAPGGVGVLGGASGGTGAAESATGTNGQQSSVLAGTSCNVGRGANTAQGNGGGGGGGGNSLCRGGDAGGGGTFAGGPGDATPGNAGSFGSGGGGAGARGQGDEPGLPGGAGGDGVVIVFWGEEAKDFVVSAAGSASGVVMSDAAIMRIRIAMLPLCDCLRP